MMTNLAAADVLLVALCGAMRLLPRRLTLVAAMCGATAISARAAVSAGVDTGGFRKALRMWSTGPRGPEAPARCRWTVTVEREGVVMMPGHVFFKSPTLLRSPPLQIHRYLRLTPSQISSARAYRITTSKAALGSSARLTCAAAAASGMAQPSATPAPTSFMTLREPLAMGCSRIAPPCYAIEAIEGDR